MRPDPDHSACPGESRRHFIKKTGMAAAAVAGVSLLQLPLSARENSPAISIVLDTSDPVMKQPPVQWAVEQLRDALAARGMMVRKECPTSRRAVALELGPALGDGQFCRTTALTKALPGWAGGPTTPDYHGMRAGLEALLKLAEPIEPSVV